jgi:hypothetical protein
VTRSWPLSPSNAEVKNTWIYTYILSHEFSRRSSWLNKHRYTFTVTLSFFFPRRLYSPIWAFAASMKLSVSLQLLDRGQSAGLLGRVIRSSQCLCLCTNTEKRTHIRHWVGFEPTIPACDRAKTVHALDHWAAVTGTFILTLPNFHDGRGVLDRGCCILTLQLVIATDGGRWFYYNSLWVPKGHKAEVWRQNLWRQRKSQSIQSAMSDLNGNN